MAKKAKGKSLPVATGMVAMMASPAEDMKYKARYALEDIERAEGHRRDPDLMKHVKKLAKEKVQSLKKVCGDSD